MACGEDKLRELFHKADTSGNGNVSPMELKKLVAKEFGVDISNEDLSIMFCGLDKNKDGDITMEEFLGEMGKKDRRQAFTKAFKDSDTDGNGKLSKDEIKRLLKQHGCSEEETEEMFAGVDTDQDDYISYDEFMAMV